MPLKDKFINFRATEKEIRQIDILARKAKMTRSDFIRHAIFNKEIVVIDGVHGVQKELKRIGNNLNQLTTRANMGQMQVLDLDETKMEVTKIYNTLTQIYELQNAHNAVQTPEVVQENKDEDRLMDEMDVVPKSIAETPKYIEPETVKEPVQQTSPSNSKPKQKTTKYNSPKEKRGGFFGKW